jgi:hypothetical protein
MCFCIFFDTFFKSKNLVCDGGDDDGLTSPMPGLSDRRILDGDADADDDDGLTMPGLLARHILVDDDHDDCFIAVDATDFSMERASAPASIVNQKKKEDRHRQFLDMYSSSDDDSFAVDASDALVERASAPALVVDGSIPFGAVRVPFVGSLSFADDDGDEDGDEDDDADDDDVPDLEDPTKFRDPLSHFDPDDLRVYKKAIQDQIDQKKLELRNLGMDVPSDQTILGGLDIWTSFGLINEAIKKDPVTSKRDRNKKE